MSASSGWDYPPPPMHGLVRPPVDQSGEPVGYNLSDLPLYEQPPARPLQPYRVTAPINQATQGFQFSLVSLITSVSVVTAPIAVVGLVVSAIALSRSRPGTSDRSHAIAGVVLGVLALLVSLLVLLNTLNGSEAIVP
jgi:hypothetical protein